MADPQRTHAPTPKRVREFRKRGDIALSRDLVSAAALAGGVIGLAAFASAGGAAVVSLTRDAIDASGRGVHDGLTDRAVHCFALAAAPVMIGTLIGAAIAIGGQIGWPPALRGLAFNLGRLAPMTNLKQALGLAGVARRSATSLAKLTIVGAIVVFAIRHAVVDGPLAPSSVAELAWSAVWRALVLVLCALVGLAAIDYVIARRRIAAQMRMTPDEVKRDHREAEGDPAIRGRRRARMRELAKRRIASVAKADVVVVNPTHYAVALRYDQAADRAPIVLAKGVDEVAEKIREVARKHGVPVMSRPPLARALHKHVKEGHPIPANLYRAVAEVLAYVYRLRAPRGEAAR